MLDNISDNASTKQIIKYAKGLQFLLENNKKDLVSIDGADIIGV